MTTSSSTLDAPQVQVTCTPPQFLMQMISGYWVTQALYSIGKLDIATQLKDGPLSVTELAKNANIHEENLFRVMRALASLGIFSQYSERVFGLTPVSQLIRSDIPNSMLPVLLMAGEEHYTAWGKLYKAVESDAYPFETVFGIPVFEYFKQNQKAGETFNAAMTALVRNDHAALVENYDFSSFKTIVDVGGGHGMLLAAILKQYPQLSGVLFDLPHVTSEAHAYLKDAGVADRCKVESGSFFEAVTEGGDAYILSHIIHDWTDEQSIQILKTVHRAMPAHGKLLLAESVVTPEADIHTAPIKLMDLNMMVMTGGKERTTAEFASLLEKAGFKMTQVIATPGSICSIVEAVRQ